MLDGLGARLRAGVGRRAGSPARSTTSWSRAELDGPVIVYDYPRETSPLAKPHRDDPDLVERFEVIVAGRELANAYSELNDPVEQLARFREEAAAKAAGDPEAGDVDLDYVRALEYGMPPAGRHGHGHRPPHHAAGRGRLDPRGHPVPDAAARGRPRPRTTSAAARPTPDPALTPVRHTSLRARVIGWLTALVGRPAGAVHPAPGARAAGPRLPRRAAAACGSAAGW